MLLRLPKRIPSMTSSDLRYQRYVLFCRERDLPVMDYEKWLKVSDGIDTASLEREREHPTVRMNVPRIARPNLHWLRHTTFRTLAY